MIKYIIQKIEQLHFIHKIPYIVIFMLLIVIPPLGVLLLVVRVKKEQKKIYHWSKYLIHLGIFVLFLIGVGLYTELKDMIVLFDSGMSLDMMNLIPNNIYLYLFGIFMMISCILGGNYLKKQAKIWQVYTKLINLEHETSIEKIGGELNLPMEKVKENIAFLKDKNYLIPITVNDKNNKISYNQTSNIKETNKKVIQCSKCGAVITLKTNQYVECDFCGNGFLDNN